jgi:hypothetical protein
MKPRFGVTVHRVPTVDFSILGNEKDEIQKIMEESDLAARGFHIDETSTRSPSFIILVTIRCCGIQQ